MMKMFTFSGKCKSVNAIEQTKKKNILQETIQWIMDITDTCFTDFFDGKGLHTRHWKPNIGTRHEKKIYEVKSMKKKF